MERNRIFMDRTIGTGAISAERALSYSFTGPNLRAAGVDYDVRVAQPYSSYEDFDFIVPIGTAGDTYDRFMVRQTEIWKVKIIKKLMKIFLRDLTTQMYQISIFQKRQMCTPKWKLLSTTSKL
jgi:NADH:ubiquinone oxidoreductase subunit D